MKSYDQRNTKIQKKKQRKTRGKTVTKSYEKL